MLIRIFEEIKKSLHLAIPFIAAEFLFAFSTVAATAMAAHLGKVQLAANALAWGIYITIMVFFMGLYSAVSIMTAQSYGAKEHRAVGIVFKQGLMLSIICSIPMLLVFLLATKLFYLTGQNPAVIHYATPFFISLAWSVLPFSLLFVMEQLLVGIGKARVVTFMSMLQLLLEVVFFYLFVFGKFGLPALGLPAIGYGIVFANTILTIGFAVYLTLNNRFKCYQLFNNWWVINRKFLFELFRVGLPLAFIYCIEVALFGTLPFLMGKLGVANLGAYQIGYQFWLIALTMLFGLSQTATVRVGYEVGRNDKNSILFATYTNIGIGLVFALVFIVLYTKFAGFLVQLDLAKHIKANKAVFDLAVKFLGIIAIVLLGDSFRLISLGALRGMKDTKFPIVASVVGFWVIAFPLGYWFAFPCHYGGSGIFWGMVIGLFIGGVILFARFHYLINRVDLEALVTRE
ncbi:MAG: MATE family efflux transporter [Gammaproteobacteria bacterium]|nr:MATE family efflux transporter [Gammaproteobacteria bacterium]